MIRYECDRCGKQQSISLSTVEINPYSHRYNEYTKELCESCLILLNTFLTKLPLELKEYE